jgi:hypothetical protein
MSFATVYFYRPRSSPGGAVALDIKDNGIDIGALRKWTLFSISGEFRGSSVYADLGINGSATDEPSTWSHLLCESRCG